ncbi:hypothetical protein K491DRAFT_705436 [Lophiostoma macrostomum CBS 122681]|uniref:Zn(2)-C6 fungal-type domain-containing protein n=1 Tax=Lophiostoma macrostomum CBS 122681 TaxID=1314788 RepID=A0A6A6T5F3_9PLEO|nr:hypothetical protein K491DRAFT_705436 [Lophiostoma macrostomum CBS 122681]
MRKRNRACEECHRLKIKCDVSPTSGEACERCSRNNVQCVPAAPRLQRHRINELEAQIQELRNAMREQRGSTTPSQSPGMLVEYRDQTVLAFLDARIPFGKQEELLQLFPQYAGAAWPVIRIPMELEHLRAGSPALLLSLLVHFGTHDTLGIELEVHDELVRETPRILADQVIGQGQRSIELVQALLVAAFWNKPARGGPQGGCYQFIQLAADMAIDLGIAGSSLLPSPVAYFSRHEDPTSQVARRTWLACFVALATTSLHLRRAIAFPWNAYHEECILFLESVGEISDILLCQIVRIVQLNQEISERLCLCQLDKFLDGNDYQTHAIIEVLKNKLDAWAARTPPSLASSQTLKVWWHVSMIHLYEPLLHTPTNKASFAVPFIPGRIAVKDFPKPTTIIPPLRLALEALVQHCHAVIDIASAMDPALVLSLPSFNFPPVVLYALYILVTTLVAATDPTNTYGQCLAQDKFCIEHFGLKLRSLTSALKSFDPTLSYFTTRMIDATSWLEEWHNDYKAIVQRYEMKLVD